MHIQPLLLFFFNDTATTEIYTLSLHDALPIFRRRQGAVRKPAVVPRRTVDRLQRKAWRQDRPGRRAARRQRRSEEHTSELQSPCNLVCRLLLEKKKATSTHPTRQLLTEAFAHC